jgi:peptide-methionine (S)-S-oxide reductase
MKMKKSIVFALVVSLFSCQTKSQETIKEEKAVIEEVAAKTDKVAVFASGCFWCSEHIFSSLEGVSKVTSGYAGGIEENPTYEKVSRHETSYAEAIEIYYDEKIISFDDLVQVFFDSHDPTTLNQQGPDIGESYRSIAFYSNTAEKKIIDDKIAKLTKEKAFKDPIVTEIMPTGKFYKAEDYHQNFVLLNPNQGYVKGVSIPRYEAFAKKCKRKLKAQ